MVGFLNSYAIITSTTGHVVWIQMQKLQAPYNLRIQMSNLQAAYITWVQMQTL